MKHLLMILCLCLSVEAFAKKPILTLNSKHILGTYYATTDPGCIDGVDICYEASILKNKGKLEIHFGGHYSDKELELKETKNGVLVFSQSNYDDDCDDAGCANTLKISGVVYPKKIKGKWITQIKARIDLECGHEDYDPEGCRYGVDYNYLIRMRKK